MQEQETNRKPKKFDFKNLTKEQKEKGIAYFFVGIVVCGFFAYGISNYDTKEDNSVDDFTNPQSELTQYNNKTDAINDKPFTNSDDGNLEMQFSETPTPQTEEFSFKSLDEQIASANTGNTVQRSSNTQPTNSHNVYGNYDMWQADEPRNNSVGYTNKSIPISSSQETPKITNLKPTFTEVQPSKTVYQEPTFQTPIPSKSVQQGTEIRAKLLSQGFITAGRSISFVLLESTKVGDVIVPKGQAITGVSYEKDNRLMVVFSTIKVKNKSIPVKMQLVGTDGMAGLPIGGSNNNNDIGTEAANSGKGAISEQVNKIPIIGRVISGAISGGNRTSDNRIKLNSNIECTIINYN